MNTLCLAQNGQIRLLRHKNPILRKVVKRTRTPNAVEKKISETSYKDFRRSSNAEVELEVGVITNRAGCAVGDSFILQDDNARPYRARLVENYLREESIAHIGWPVRYPYLNPFEHVWYSLGKRISPLNPLATTLQGLGTALTQQWTLLPINKQHHSEHGILCPSCIAIRGFSHSILKLIMH
ncbi:hypothetical protein AVEN_20740-1 [Araneus ventricosus]|uniref:Tc1-like transposase DDE domain-containing protein n=1 Tax=Araneus ventricosus TaxID=182803 RepID=A0A4Y2UMD1_ARAVE|nr:hypothetical protein AVEN_20740-1 [Araneus ventricosus]